MGSIDLFTTFAVSASGLDVQRQRLSVIAENIANAHSTRTEKGGPYRRKEAVIQAVPLEIDSKFRKMLDSQDVNKARVVAIEESRKELQKIHDPGHPDADKDGFVTMPNVSTSQELIQMMSAARAYEANVTAYNATKTMMLKTLDLGGI